MDSWSDVWDALAKPWEGDVPAKAAPRSRPRRTIREAITDLAESVLWFFFPHPEPAKEQDRETLLALITAMQGWWRKHGRTWSLSAQLRNRGHLDEDIEAHLVETLIRRQGVRTTGKKKGQLYGSRYTPTRLSSGRVGDPMEAYCGVQARGVLLNLWAKDSDPTMEWDADRDTDVDAYAADDDEEEAIGLRLDRRRTTGSTQADRDRPPVVIRRRG